jgi:phosphatidylinositol-3-phosphatase
MSRGAEPTRIRVPRVTWIVTAVLLGAALAGCGASGTEGSSTTAQSAASAAKGGVSRIAMIVLENHEYDEVVDAPSAPFLNQLALHSAVAANYHAVAHPSLPNYLALTGGSTFGYVGHDCGTCWVSHRNLIDELEAAGISWKAYIEDLPKPCSFAESSGGYYRRHDPFMYYRDVADNRSRCRNVVPATELTSDIVHHTLPRFIWLSPNICHDMHSCGISTGDAYLKGIIPRLLPELGPHGILFITFDEGETNDGCCQVAAGGHILTLIAGPGARAGSQSAAPYDHYSLLRTIEDLWGLPRLGYAAAPYTHAMTDLLRVRSLR